MPANAKMADTQMGIKSTDSNNTMEAKMRMTILLYYIEASLEASPI